MLVAGTRCNMGVGGGGGQPSLYRPHRPEQHFAIQYLEINIFSFLLLCYSAKGLAFDFGKYFLFDIQKYFRVNFVWSSPRKI